MSDDYTTLNTGTAGDSIDEEGVTYGTSPTTRKRPRVVIAGSQALEVVVVKSSDPASTDYGLVVRPIFPAQNADSSSLGGPMVQGEVNDSPSSALTDGTVAPLSITTDGRLRVSVADARISVPFFEDSWKDMWDEGPNMTKQHGSPWGGW